MRLLQISSLLAFATSLTACGSSDSGDTTGSGADAGTGDAGSAGTGGTDGGAGGESSGGAGAGGSGAGGSGGTANAGSSGGGTAGSGAGGSVGGGGAGIIDGGAGSSAGGSTGPGADGGGGACAEVAQCCPTAGIFQPSCEQLTSQGVDVQCDAVRSLYCGNATDGGGAPGPDGGSAACDSLDTCCTTLSGAQQTQCEQIVAIGLPLACSQLEFALCP